MSTKKSLKTRLFYAVLGLFFAFINLFNISNTISVNAIEDTETAETVEVEETEEESSAEATDSTNSTPDTSNEKEQKTCTSQVPKIGWLVCSISEAASAATDLLFEKLESVIEVDNLSSEADSPIYKIWQYCRDITNIVFIIFLLIVVASQITGIGISNYGIKKALPKLIVAAIMVNVSFLICELGIEISNIFGAGIKDLFEGVKVAAMGEGTTMTIPFGELFAVVAGGVGGTVAGIVIAVETGAIWMFIPTILSAIVSVLVALFTMVLRKALIILLVMVAPLAIVSNILPNTEQYFKKWKDMLTKMLVFYPIFSLLFGAADIAGWAIMAGADGDAITILIGLLVKFVPLVFSWKLLKMSGTIVGDIGQRIRGLADKPIATNRAWADSHRAETRAYNLQYGKTPYMRLQRYLDDRKALRAQTTESLTKIRKNEANIYVQKKIGAGYDGTKATEANNGHLKPNRYTRIAKDLSNTNLASTTATLDTAHTISNYGNYYIDDEMRKRIANAKKAKDSEQQLARLKQIDSDYARAAAGANNYLELHRAQMAAENDEEADFNFMVGEYLKANFSRDKGEAGMKKFNHYITASAGGLGAAGEGRVLGKIIAKAASVESNQRRDINIIAAKFPPDKRNFRNMVVGYYVDDDGFATDKEGNRIEDIRGDLLTNHPEKLVMWDHFDENGAYFDWYDSNGNYVTRIHKNDKSAIKELLSNFDAPINDPINNLYGILSGISEDPSRKITGHIGLDAYRTTVGRAILSAPFKEKNACFSPMVADMVKKGYIQNFAQENLAYLDSLNKATKPGAFNTQDADAVKTLNFMMDPDNWEKAFPTELIRGYRNVNGEQIYGIRYDGDGHKIKVDASEATREELMNRVKEKYIFPAAHKMVAMMSRQTPNTSDNQKAGTAEEWRKFKAMFDEKYVGIEGMQDPYEQAGDTREMARDIQQKLYTLNDDGTKHMIRQGKQQRGNNGGANHAKHQNHHVVLDDIRINANGDPDTFARDFTEYCDGYSELSRVRRDFTDFVADHAYSATLDELYDFALDLLDSYTNLD